MAISWDYAQISLIGGRELNEDSSAHALSGDSFMAVVADGLGGHGHGEVASSTLTDVFLREFNSGSTTDPSAFLSSAFEAAQSEIMRIQEERHTPDEIKTTAAALAVTGGTACWAHCGDTRLYYFHKNKLKARTLDHSVPQMLVLAGEIKERHIPSHPDRNKLLRVVGVPWETPRYQLGDPMEVTENSAFLLCTDGFWEYITNRMIIKYLKKTKSAGDWLALMTADVEKNAKSSNADNYTAAVIRAAAN